MSRLALLTAVLCTAAVAGDITPEQAAKIARERTKAVEEVNQKYGNRKSSELSAEERRQQIKDQSEAVSKVYEKNGVSAKEFSRYEATASREERAAATAHGAALEKKEADEKKAAEDKKAAEAKPKVEVSNGVIIERGIDPKDLPPNSPPPRKGKK